MTTKENLLSIPENEVLTLSPLEAYERLRAITKSEASTQLREAGYNPNPQVKDKTPSKPFYKPVKVYKNWGGD